MKLTRPTAVGCTDLLAQPFMTIKIGLWIIPLLISLVMLGIMCRPYQRCGDYDFGSIFRLFWLLPIAVVWLAYMGLMLWLR